MIETIKTSPHRSGLELKLHKSSILSSPRTPNYLALFALVLTCSMENDRGSSHLRGNVWTVPRTVISTEGSDKRRC